MNPNKPHHFSVGLLIAGASFCVLIGAACGTTIVQPVAVSSNMASNASTPIASLIDQSGLSPGYTSNTTDFDTFLGLNPTHESSASSVWFSFGDLTGHVDFDLGGTYLVEGFVLWNRGDSAVNNVVGFNLLGSSNALFDDSVMLLSSQNANPNTGPLAAVQAEVFSFSPQPISHVRLVITSNNGSTNNTSFSEVAFEGVAVPEPSSALLLGLGGIAMLILARSRSGRDEMQPIFGPRVV